MQEGEQSEMIRSLDKLVKCVGIAIIPIGIVLFVQAFFFQNAGFQSSITSMVAAVIGMPIESYMEKGLLPGNREQTFPAGRFQECTDYN